jgi:cytoskeletal protein CcmA (bactofilin family)
MLNREQERMGREQPQPLATPTRLSVPVSAENGADKGTIIGRSVIIKGEVSGSESLCIEGKVEGAITLPDSSLTVGRNGQVNAMVMAREVVIQGKVVGDVDADRLNVRSEGSLTGDVVVHRIMVEEGAFFKGKIDIRDSSQDGPKLRQ